MHEFLISFQTFCEMNLAIFTGFCFFAFFAFGASSGVTSFTICFGFARFVSSSMICKTVCLIVGTQFICTQETTAPSSCVLFSFFIIALEFIARLINLSNPSMLLNSESCSIKAKTSLRVSHSDVFAGITVFVSAILGSAFGVTGLVSTGFAGANISCNDLSFIVATIFIFGYFSSKLLNSANFAGSFRTEFIKDFASTIWFTDSGKLRFFKSVKLFIVQVRSITQVPVGKRVSGVIKLSQH